MRINNGNEQFSFENCQNPSIRLELQILKLLERLKKLEILYFKKFEKLAMNHNKKKIILIRLLRGVRKFSSLSLQAAVGAKSIVLLIITIIVQGDH